MTLVPLVAAITLGDDWKAKRGHRRAQFVMARIGDAGMEAAAKTAAAKRIALS